MEAARIRFKDVTKTYGGTVNPVRALKSIDLNVRDGDFLIVMGPSGSGKSTLLHLMGTLDSATRGEIWINQKHLQDLSDDEKTLLRRHELGFVFQFFHLLPTLTAFENVVFPALLDGIRKEEIEPRGIELLTSVGLQDRLHHTPDQLSGGEMQRVAIARALIHNPPILLADEPTGNLDRNKGEEVLELLRDLNQSQGKTIVIVTHDARSTQYGNRLIQIQDGAISSDERINA